MASTRMRVNHSASVFHRIAAAGDMPAHDVSTSDTVVSSLGGTADFELESDETVAHVSASKVQDTTEAAIGSAAIADYIYIKNSGFTSSAKTTATTSNLTVGVGGAFASGGFTLAAGEAITLHGLGGGSDNLSEFQLDSSSGDIYVEIAYL
tara:strand:- start:43 stop:495 length:453 start_codon:yes stop_codon:yes gene_type:complete